MKTTNHKRLKNDEKSLIKSVRAKLCLNGQSGQNGKNGIDGKSGMSGSDGKQGRNGDRGANGIDGTHGQSGKSGTDAFNGVIYLSGDVKNIHVQLQKYYQSDNLRWDSLNLVEDEEQHNFQLNKSKNIILIEALGGNGGDGGHGGDGGCGGNGGQGGYGHDGANGVDRKDHAVRQHDTYDRIDSYSHNYMEDNGSGSYSRHADGVSGSNGYGFGFGDVKRSNYYQRSLEMTQRSNDYHRLHDRINSNSDHDSHRSTIGGHGSHGEQGGHGGHGGHGGQGGRGGRGGNAGAGGHLRICTTDPRLFMLIDIKCCGGKEGKGGRGGTGGVNGRGGQAGRGGKGGRGGNGTSNGRDGSTGNNGTDGRTGESGLNGTHGQGGMNGSVEFVVMNLDGEILKTASDKYHATVHTFHVTDENNDGIYEPHSNIIIDNVQWRNDGQMDLPSGSILSFSSTNHVTSDKNDISILKDAKIDETIVDSYRFRCHINQPLQLSINQPFIQSIRIASKITLFNVQVADSELSTSITCQYPIQIRSIEVPTFLGLGERGTARLTFENISTRPYGIGCQSAGSIQFLFSTHPSFRIISMQDEYNYQIKSPGRIQCTLNGIVLPKSTKLLICQFSLNSDEIYENLIWNIDLMLRDVAIERHIKYIRIVPVFLPTRHTDVLLVTNRQTKREEYLAYQILFQLFNYSFQTWDLERYGEFHHPELVWLKTAHLIIFIHSKPHATFNMIKSHLLLQHLRFSDTASFICVGDCLSDEFDFVLFDYNKLHHIHDRDKQKADCSFKQSNIEELSVKADALRNNYEKLDDYQFLYQIVYEIADTTLSKSNSMCHVYNRKYVHRSSVDFHLGNRLILVHCQDPSSITANIPYHLQSILNQQHCEIEDAILLDSLFGRLLCAMVSCQNHEKSLQMIEKNKRLSTCTFKSTTINITFEYILISHFMSIIERECNRGSVHLSSSERCLGQIIQMIAKAGQNIILTGWTSMMAQTLHHYIDNRYTSMLPWRISKSQKKQRKKLEQFLKSLRSLSSRKLLDNQWFHPPMQTLRLQELAKLQHPASDTRQSCIRPIEGILPWKLEQQML